MKNQTFILSLFLIILIFLGCDNFSTNKNNKIENLEKRVSILEQNYNNLQSEEFRKIIVDNLNIREGPSSNTEIVAVAYKSAYLRVLSEENGWLLVEYFIDNFPFIGYISGNDTFSVKELLPVDSQLSINKRGLIKIFWETEIKEELERISCDLVGIYIDTPNNTFKSEIKNHLVNYFRDEKIYLKAIQSFNEENVSQVFANESVCSVISIKVNNSNQDGNIYIQLFGPNEVIYYSISLPVDGKLFD